MSITEKIRRLEQLMQKDEEDYLRGNPPEPGEDEDEGAWKQISPPLPEAELARLHLPVWGGLHAIEASPMVREWFAHANGWNSYLLGRRSLSIAEMRQPWTGLSFYEPWLGDPEESRREQVLRHLTMTIPYSVELVREDPLFRTLAKPELVLFSLPFTPNIVGAGFLVFSPDIAEPMVFENDFIARDLEHSLDCILGDSMPLAP